MAHRGTGIHRLLELPAMYQGLQDLLGGRRSRARFVSDHVRPAPGHHVLDIGCGTAAILAALPDDVHYVGYDLNPRYIAEARRRFGARGRFFCASVEDAPVDAGEYDVVLARSLLHHLTETQALHLVEAAYRALRPDGVLVTIDPVRHPGQSRVARVLMALDRGASIRTPDAYRALLGRRFARVEAWQRTDLARIPYTHFIMRATKAAPS